MRAQEARGTCKKDLLDLFIMGHVGILSYKLVYSSTVCVTCIFTLDSEKNLLKLLYRGVFVNFLSGDTDDSRYL